jgi:hypothetical protein
MAERAKLFDTEDFDVSSFAPKKAGTIVATPSAAIREVSESVNFQSREPVHSDLTKSAGKKLQSRRRRTGRNLQLNLKVAAHTLESFYQIADRHGWVLGEAFEKALAALERELATTNE